MVYTFAMLYKKLLEVTGIGVTEIYYYEPGNAKVLTEEIIALSIIKNFKKNNFFNIQLIIFLIIKIKN